MVIFDQSTPMKEGYVKTGSEKPHFITGTIVDWIDISQENQSDFRMFDFWCVWINVATRCNRSAAGDEAYLVQCVDKFLSENGKKSSEQVFEALALVGLLVTDYKYVTSDSVGWNALK